MNEDQRFGQFGEIVKSFKKLVLLCSIQKHFWDLSYYF